MKTIILIITTILQFSLLCSQDSEQIEDYSTVQKVYVVIADTSQNYYELNSLMYELEKKLNLKVDTLGKTFNEKKNMICLPDEDEYQMYAGDYFPRRHSSDFLSLEYFDYYREANLRLEDKTIALVVLISSDETMAQKKLNKIKKNAKNAFIYEGKINIGCMN